MAFGPARVSFVSQTASTIVASNNKASFSGSSRLPTPSTSRILAGGSRRMLLADAPPPPAVPAAPVGPVPNTLEVGWRWPASAVWVQRVRRADPLPTLEVVSFSISFAGLNATTLLHPSDTVGVNKSFTQQLGAQVRESMRMLVARFSKEPQ